LKQESENEFGPINKQNDREKNMKNEKKSNLQDYGINAWQNLGLNAWQGLAATLAQPKLDISGLGLNKLNSLAQSFAQQTHSKFYLNELGISKLNSIALSYAQQMKPVKGISNVLSGGIQAQLAAIQYPNFDSPLSRLTSSFAKLGKRNQLVAEKLSGFAVSQILLSNNISKIFNEFEQSHLSKFNSINIAIQNLTSEYLKNIAIDQNWEDISIAEEANLTISNIADDLLNDSTPLTTDDLDNFKQSIISELWLLHGRTNTKKAGPFILNLIAVISFLLTLYGVYQSNTDKSNQDVINETHAELKRIEKEISQKIEFEFQKINKTRIARTNVNLKFADKETCKIIGIVKSGQQVTVLEIRHKYLLIAYIDYETGEPKSGFVVKKHFIIEK
jgi:hypothetical protein